MKVANAEQMRALDRAAIEEYGIPGIVLMENAALGVIRCMESRYGACSNKRVLILCGKGNNGGDGLAVARHLVNRGVSTSVIVLGLRKDIRGDAAVNLRICESMGIAPRFAATSRQVGTISASIRKADLIVDAILGTGIVPPVRGVVAQVLAKINGSKRPVISVDLPSGLSANSSEISGDVVQAELTVTFGLPKISLVQYPSLAAAGEVQVVDISLPAELVNKADIPVELIGQTVLKRLPVRKKDLHKGNAGKALVVAGSQGMPGAAMMTSLAAFRIGAGLVYAAIPSAIRASYHRRLMESIVVPLPESEGKYLTRASLAPLLHACKGKNVAAVGPGIGLDPETGEMIRSLIRKVRIPLILDADGINQIAADPAVLKQAKVPVIITPHPGEMAKLTGASRQMLTTRRVDLARDFAAEHGVIVVFKGARTVVASPGGRVWINTTGNPGMATAGTGDVLTGVIAGLAAQGIGFSVTIRPWGTNGERRNG
jgi:NAD(P)H-hydrate epimerase